MVYLVTGGCGFVGSALTAELLRRGASVLVFDNLSRVGGTQNLEWLRSLGPVEFSHGDSRNVSDVAEVFRGRDIGCVFHLAGQVAMTTSLREPRKDFETNVVGTINILEAVRNFSPEATVVYASSNKVYGELSGLQLQEAQTRYATTGSCQGVAEDAQLDFRTPYGCSKGAADQYVLEYARSFSLRTVVFRHSTIYGGRQFSTFDQGWIGWFCQQALATVQESTHQFTVNGDGKQVRDLLHVTDAIRCYLTAHENIHRVSGQAFNIGGGIENSMSVLELLGELGARLNVRLNARHLPWRTDDQRYFVADITKATNLLGWAPSVSKQEGLEEVLSTLAKRNNLSGTAFS
jgi:CDP-paratose 2-epimerase